MNKPWDNEPTPQTDAECRSGEYAIDIESPLDMCGTVTLQAHHYVLEPNYGDVVFADIARKIERRMRAAERLLNATIDGIYPLVPDHDILFDDIKAHLEAAKKEDKQ